MDINTPPTLQELRLANKYCPDCNRYMRYNTKSKRNICPVCGKTTTFAEVAKLNHIFRKYKYDSKYFPNE